MCDMGGCRPADPLQRVGPDSPVSRLIRREHSYHLRHGLFDIVAVHPRHTEQLSRSCLAAPYARHPLIGKAVSRKAIGSEDAGGVPVEVLAGALWRIVVRGSAWRAAICMSRRLTP